VDLALRVQVHQTTKQAIEDGIAYLKRQKQEDDATEAKEHKENKERREEAASDNNNNNNNNNKFRSADAMGRAIQRAALEMPTFVDANM
jgi:hypothetical protein